MRRHGTRMRMTTALIAGLLALGGAIAAAPVAGAATATATATPHTDLGYRGFVAVHGTNLPPNTAVRTSECGVGPAQSACQDGATGTTDASGTIDLNVPFRRTLVQVITVNENGAVLAHADCIQTGTSCSISLSLASSPFTQLANVPITFDPSAPVPSPPTLVVTPSTNLAARPIVGVSGSGFFPNHVVTISECTAGVTVFGTELCPGPASTTVADATGHISTIAIVSRWLGSGLGVTDCATAVGNCTFRATTDPSTFYLPDASEVARVPLGFDPTTTPPPGPPVSITPRTGLSDQQVVTVSGSKFVGGHRIAIVPCRNASTFTPIDCHTDAPVTFLADGTGAFSQQFPVPQFFVDGHRQTVDCGASTLTCMLAIVDYQDSSVAKLVPVSFAHHGPIPVAAFRSRSITEPTGASHSTKIDLVLSAPTDHQVSVVWETDFTSGTADYTDFSPKSRTTVIPAGQTRATVLVDVTGDHNDEPDEWFGMHIDNALGATVGPDARITIKDDDPPPTLRLEDVTVPEGDGLSYAQVPVRFDTISAFPMSVRYHTYQFTARAGRDFVETTGTLVVPPNHGGAAIAVVILGDKVHEGTETLLVTIDQPTHATIGTADAVLTITDDD